MKTQPEAAISIAWLRAMAICVLLLCGCWQVALARQGEAVALNDTASPAAFPDATAQHLEMLNVRDADLRDLLRGIAHQYNLNLKVDNRIDRRVTLRLANLPVIEALTFLCEEYDLVLNRSGHILRVNRAPLPALPPPPPLALSVQDSLLTVDLQEADLEQVVRAVARQSRRNIVVRQGVRGHITGMLQSVPLVAGLRTLLQHNGFVLREADGILLVDRAGLAGAEQEGATRSFWIQANDSLVTLDVVEAPIADVLREVAAQMTVNLVTYAVPETNITARVAGLTLEETLNFLFKGSSITYRRDGEVYFIGSKQTSGIAVTRLVPLNHIRADAVLELLPPTLKGGAAIQVVKEHNGLMVTSTHDVIDELEQFVREIDYPTPQILIEALVIDFESTDLFELGLSFGRNAQTAERFSDGRYGFGGTDGFGRGFEARGDGETANGILASVANLFGIQKIGRLPPDFYFRVHALSKEGKVNVRSRPQISTLNGHAAHISIGTTQYYILRTETPYTSPGQVVLQQTERFEKVEASVKLEVVPWVSASGEVTTEIRPEFSTPVGEFDPEVPPTINSRILESTVRLQDGETIILGGLIQEAEQTTQNRVPILGSIPLLGRLFRSESRTKKKAELVIFLTPHVFYGDVRDGEKWQSLQDQLQLSQPVGPKPPRQSW